MLELSIHLLQLLLQSLKLLSVMAAIRLDGGVDNINDILSAALLKKDDADESNTSGGPLASMTWEQVILVCIHRQ